MQGKKRKDVKSNTTIEKDEQSESMNSSLLYVK